jgi:hypothetical protein
MMRFRLRLRRMIRRFLDLHPTIARLATHRRASPVSCRLTGIDPTTRELLDLTVERPQCNPEK